MSGNKYPKKFQLHLTEEQHANLREAAFAAKVSMMECVRGWIGEKCSVDLKIGNVVLEPDEPVKPIKKAVPVTIGGEVITAKCARCFDVFPVTKLIVEPRTGKKFCPDCVENMKSGQA